jgi:hypothetical protein
MYYLFLMIKNNDIKIYHVLSRPSKSERFFFLNYIKYFFTQQPLNDGISRECIHCYFTRPFAVGNATVFVVFSKFVFARNSYRFKFYSLSKFFFL